MNTRLAQQPPSALDPEDVNQTLESILSSKHFVNAHKKKKFLRLICDFYIQGRAQELNEHILGYDVFGRDSSYSPSDDPIVRVFAHEIRKKLEAYYANEGAGDSIRLEIPAGSYQPVFTRHLPEQTVEISEASTLAQPEPETETPRLSFSTGKVAAGLIGLCLAITVVALMLANRQLQQQVTATEAAKDPAIYGAVWTPFLTDSNPPLVILSNPPIFRFTNPSDPEALTKDSIPLAPKTIEALKGKFVTNPEVSIKESGGPAGNGAQAPADKIVIERNQTPSLILSTNIYTGQGEAIGLHYLTDFFRKTSRSIQLKRSRTMSAEDLKKRNLIILGGVWVNEWSSKLTRNEDFVFTSKATIENRNPRPGEDREYIPQFDRQSGNLISDYAIITVKPNLSDANEVMLLAGVYNQGTEAAAEYVTNKNYLDQLNQRLQQSGAPRYFQALIKVGVEDGIPTTISILALHELNITDR
ncbi:MAG: hypothetical protein WBV94_08335 [Blastocatellia bacterium]